MIGCAPGPSSTPAARPRRSPAARRASKKIGKSTMIDGKTKLIAHIGYPTESFKAPMIYNPWFEKRGINAVVVPMGCKADDYAAFFPLLFRLSNVMGALVTMPHKIATMALLDQVSVSAKVAGACNAVRLDGDGRLIGDMFDGEGFVRGVLRKGHVLA